MDFNSVTELTDAHLYKIVWTVVWVALSLLTITLLTVMRAKPLSKCVFLSLFAHILLVGHAYMTNLKHAPGPGNGEVFTVTLRDSNDLLPDNAQSPSQELQPWERHVAEDSLVPENLDLAQELIQAESQPQRLTDDKSLSLAVSVPTEMAIAGDIQISGDQPRPVESSHTITTDGIAAKIEFPKAQQRAESTPSGPTAQSMARPTRNIGDEAPLHRPTRTEFPTEAIAATPNVQRLADAPTGDAADALASSNDVTSATLNRTLPGIGASRTPMAAPGQTLPDQVASTEPSVGGVGQTDSPTRSASAGDQPDASAGNDDTHSGAETGPTRTASGRRLANGQPLPDIYQNRVQIDRGAIAREHGGSEQTEAAVAAALRWLAANQEADGRWDADKHGAGRETRVFGHDRKGAGTQADTGVTALALLAFMAAGNTHYEGEYRKNVQHGLEFLLKNQNRNGSMAGGAKTIAQMYCHGMATLAIAEAYAMTQDSRLKWWVERAVGYTVAAQHSTGGGWRYLPGDDGDMSQFGWQVLALRTAEIAGIPMEQKTRNGLARFISRCGSGRHGGLASYRPAEDVSAAMTAESLACRYFLGWAGDSPAVDEAANYIDARRPGREKVNLYYWYYGTLAMHQVGGERWTRWNQALQTRLLPIQRKGGNLAGSWDPDTTMWGGYGGRVYTTSMAALCLESYYRFGLTSPQ